MNSVEKSNKNSRENVKISKKKGKNRKINQQNDENKKIVDESTNIDGASNNEIVIKSLNGNFEENLQINENGSIIKNKLNDEFLNGSSEELSKNPKNQLNGGENSKSFCGSSSSTSKNSSKKSKRKSINNDEIKITTITNNGDNKNNDNSTDNNSGMRKISCDLTKNNVLDDNRSNIDEENIIKACNSNLSNNSENCQKKITTKIDENNHHQDNCSNNSKCNQIIDIPKEIESNSNAQLLTLSPQSSSSLSPSAETEKVLDLSNVVIEYKEYESELQMQDIMRLIQAELSEPYSIYTYRYFIYNWPKLCFLAAHGNEYVGAIVCKLDMHMHVVKRGYIAMLAVKKEYRKLKIGTNLVQKAIEAMLADDADEVVLETEMKNLPALRLYENLGFVRDKRLFRYYLNGVDALRLKLWFR